MKEYFYPVSLGGPQGSGGSMFGIEYGRGSIMDIIVESFGGTHDFLNSWYVYGPDGNVREGIDKLMDSTVNAVDVPLATPFALSVLLPPEVWKAISTATNMR